MKIESFEEQVRQQFKTLDETLKEEYVIPWCNRNNVDITTAKIDVVDNKQEIKIFINGTLIKKINCKII